MVRRTAFNRSFPVATALTAATLMALAPAGTASADASADASWQPPSPETVQANVAQYAEAQPSEALLRNGGFEQWADDGAPVGWSRSFWPSERSREIAAQAMQRTSEIVREGEHALEIDSSRGDLSGRWFVLRQIISPVEPVLGQPIRFSVHALLRTMPNPDGDRVQLTIRQYKERELMHWDVKRFSHEDAEAWRVWSLDADIRDDVDMVDVKIEVGNPLPDGIAAVHVIDAAAVHVRHDEVLQTEVLSPEVSRGRRGVAISSIGEQVALDEGGVTLTHALLTEGDDAIWVSSNPVEDRQVRRALPLDELPVGAYVLWSVLEIEGVGPIAVEQSPLTIYAGPFEGESP